MSTYFFQNMAALSIVSTLLYLVAKNNILIYFVFYVTDSNMN